MKIARVIVIGVMAALTAGFSFAEDVQKTKTFDGDNIVDYTLEYTSAGKQYRLSVTLQKTENTTGIKYDPVHRFSSVGELAPILLKLVENADSIDPGKINYFMTFEYLNCDDIFLKSAQAFNHQPEWETYLSASKNEYVNPPYDFIKQQLIKEGVFSDLSGIFLPLGYDIEFSSFEKLAVRKASDFSCYPLLKQNGILPEDKFPVPLMLHFLLTHKK